MKTLNKIKGDKAEAIAANFLKKQKYKILATNYRNKLGEIDIVAQKGLVICFVEVKQRQTTAFGLPCEAVDKKKQYKIARSAQLYLLQNHLKDAEACFCVIEVLDEKINFINNAFEI